MVECFINYEFGSVHASISVRGKILVSDKIIGCSRFKRLLCFVVIAVRCLRVPQGVLELQVEGH
jgi:hypothetical protein